jgi:hypothetical protein
MLIDVSLVNVAVTFFQNVGSKIFYKEMLVNFFFCKMLIQLFIKKCLSNIFKKMFVQYFLKNVATFFNVPSSSRRGGKNMRN